MKHLTRRFPPCYAIYYPLGAVFLNISTLPYSSESRPVSCTLRTRISPLMIYPFRFAADPARKESPSILMCTAEKSTQGSTPDASPSRLSQLTLTIRVRRLKYVSPHAGFALAGLLGVLSFVMLLGASGTCLVAFCMACGMLPPQPCTICNNYGLGTLCVSGFM